ncbi:MAG: peptidylprolyl isomerase, partial [Pseudomonadota bacterium]
MFKSFASAPLVHFLFLGAAVFAAERVLLEREDDPRVILIDDARYAEIAGIFQDNQGRAPSEAAMADLTVKWAQNEVLYREAQLMGLDKGDEMIRQRLILKLRNVLFNRVDDATATRSELEDWFAQNRSRYEQPETVDIEQFQVSSGDDPASANALAAELGTGAVPADYDDALRRYARRSIASLTQVFNPVTIQALAALAPGQWAPIQSAQGWHLARITARHEGRTVTLDEVERQVLADWQQDAEQAQLTEALAAIAQDY